MQNYNKNNLTGLLLALLYLFKRNLPHFEFVAIYSVQGAKIHVSIWEMKGGTYTLTRYPKNCFTQTYRDLYGDAMLVLT